MAAAHLPDGTGYSRMGWQRSAPILGTTVDRPGRCAFRLPMPSGMQRPSLKSSRPSRQHSKRMRRPAGADRIRQSTGHHARRPGNLSIWAYKNINKALFYRCFYQMLNVSKWLSIWWVLSTWPDAQSRGMLSIW